MKQLEKKIFTLIVKDKRTEDMATKLGLTVRSVENYIFRMTRKYKIRTRTGLAVYAIKNKIVTLK
jgi:DNA-binding NarL/FixJ family response regulator